MRKMVYQQEAIDSTNKALDRETVVSRWVRKVAVDAVKVLPSAQPSATDTNVGGNIIDRQAVLKLLHALPPEEAMTKALLIQGVKQMDAAQPERKTGRWIPHEDEDGEHYGDKCSECGEWYVMPYGKTNFCPNCGADMRQREE